MIIINISFRIELGSKVVGCSCLHNLVTEDRQSVSWFAVFDVFDYIRLICTIYGPIDQC